MAITAEKVNSQLQMIFQEGLDSEGNMTYRTKRFNNVKTDASPEQLYNLAIALQPLQQKVLHRVERNDTESLLDA
ncbi:DUF1659 domain-containing protein [Thalassobacillus sp. CUG 92003]|uniref:DUF1659 domain-containing protein n=1 Tax=Thalassobacillus sp. CUG 92003 TaxID=2736641 RepID=UPI0015E75E70|nr:DUF1659 domain-containing protein [Thalassobacillus sp. CUG 92003]